MTEDAKKLRMRALQERDNLIVQRKKQQVCRTSIPRRLDLPVIHFQFLIVSFDVFVLFFAGYRSSEVHSQVWS